MNLSINNVVNVSVQQIGAGIGQYNTSNLAIFTHEEYNEDSFGTSGYKLYLSPNEVANDFGTGSVTYKMALSVFSQQPNILAGGGYLAIIPVLEDLPEVTAVQLVSFSAVPASGSYKLKYGSLTTAAIAWDDNAAAVQVALRALSGLGSITVSGNTTDGFQVTFTGVSGPATVLTVTDNSLDDSGSLNVNVTAVTTTPGQAPGTETLAAAIVRTEELIEYFGAMTDQIEDEQSTLDAAAVMQALNKILFVVQNDPSEVEVTTGILWQLQAAAFSHTRGLFYGSDTDLSALVMQAAYAGRALSTNFNGSNTTQTMHLKTLIGIVADPIMDQTLLNKCQIAGADTYVSIQGVPKVFCSNANTFFDDVYNLLWFVGAIKVGVFNVLAQVGTKITQTENGVSVLKSAIRDVCEQAITNQFLAPGRWTSPDTFGNQLDFYANITQRGYYIYSGPVSQQLPSDREDRKAPVIQVAVKYAGAIHSSDVIVYINK
jgi:hypothetical protein